MNTTFLLKNELKKIGWILFFIGLIMGSILLFNSEFSPSFLTIKNFHTGNFLGENENFFNEISLALILIGGLIVSFAKTKIEDEYIGQLRLQSFSIAFIIYHIILFIANIFLYEFDFLSFMIYNLCTMLFVFIIVFHVKLYKLSQS